MTSEIDPALASNILRTVPTQEAFMFYTNIDKYTGKNALSLNDFFEQLMKVQLKSIAFHFKRRDFERWIRLTLNDKYLANEISNIDRTMQGEELRIIIYRIVKKRLDQLKYILFQRTSTTLFKKD